MVGHRPLPAGRIHPLGLSRSQSLARGDARSAQATLFTAQRLAPRDPAVIRAGARYLTLQKDARALLLWEQLTRQPAASPDDWAAYFQSALQLRDRLTAFEALKGFDLAAPEDSVRSRQMRCQLLAALGNLEAARGIARGLVAEGMAGGNWGFFAHGLLLGGTEADRKAARAALWTQLPEDSIHGLAAATVLARDPALAEEDSRRLEDRLRTHPDAGLAQEILATSLEARRIQRRDGPEAARKVWHAFAAARPLPERITILRWMINSGGGPAAEGLITRDEAFSRKDALLVYIDLMGNRGRWDEVRRVLDDPRAVLPPLLRRTYLARTAAERRDEPDAAKQWQLAVVEGRRTPGGLAFLANYAATLRWNDRARALCEEMIRNPATREDGLLGMRLLENRIGTVSENPATLTGE